MDTFSRDHQWTVALPMVWPRPPDQFSFSTLMSMERCPRRWALTNASYPDIWSGYGYPPKAHMSALVGTVTHKALNSISTTLLDVAASSGGNTHLVHVLRQMGGYSSVIRRASDAVLGDLKGNPRSERLLAILRQGLYAHAGAIREHLQNMLARIQFQLEQVPRSPASVLGHGVGALHPGHYSEIRLTAHDIKWTGVVDLLTVTNAGCEIIDFKSGRHEPEHEMQLQVYALLWNLDSRRNPKQTSITKMALSYATQEVEVEAPSKATITALRAELQRRAHNVSLAVQSAPPDALPGEVCQHCGVRQLCETYWSWIRLASGTKSGFGDLQVELRGNNGPTSWSCVVESSNALATGSRILVIGKEVTTNWRAGDRLRILDAPISIAEDGAGQPISTLSGISEVFYLDPRK